MELGDQRGSSNIEDRRGMSIGGVGGGLGVGGIVIALIAYFLGVDPTPILNGMQQAPTASQTQQAPHGTPSDQMGQFVSKVLGSTEDVWTSAFRDMNRQYHNPTLVLYDRATRTSCGTGQTAMGPFYCPNDEKLYIDLSFFRDLETRFHAPGDFAQAYVFAH
jgi:predicted metalloprotease